MEYTKGEWFTEQSCGDAKLYQVFSNLNGKCYLMASLRPCRDAEANANLIAAAPDMYEALIRAFARVESLYESLLDSGHLTDEDAHLTEQVRKVSNQALAKAEGMEV